MADGAGGDGPDAHRSPARVREVYDDIATHFSKTRAYPWPEVEDFVASVGACERGLDVGCGNGRHMPVLANVAECVVGLDASQELLREAHERIGGESWRSNLVQGDAARVPLADESVGVAVYVATLHHLPDRGRRRQSLNELARVLRDGGRALVSAWSTESDRFDAGDAAEGFDTTVAWTLPGGETVPRFYHIYAPDEFDADLAASDLTVEDSYVSSGNCYAEVHA